MKIYHIVKTIWHGSFENMIRTLWPSVGSESELQPMSRKHVVRIILSISYGPHNMIHIIWTKWDHHNMVAHMLWFIWCVSELNPVLELDFRKTLSPPILKLLDLKTFYCLISFNLVVRISLTAIQVQFSAKIIKMWPIDFEFFTVDMIVHVCMFHW